MSANPPSRLPIGWATDALYATGPKTGSSTKVVPSAATAAQGHVAGSPFMAGYMNDWQALTEEWVNWLRLYAGGGVYGDGSDGDVTSVGNITLARNMNYNTLVLGHTLDTRSFIVRARRSVTINSGGVIFRTVTAGGAGSAGSGGAGGAGGTPAVLGTGSLGGAGGSGVGAGSAGAASNDAAVAGSGGAGGNASLSGGAGGVSANPAPAAGDFRALAALSSGSVLGASGLIRLAGGAGGGGGASNDAINGGGGGGGGGGPPIVILTPELIINTGGAIQALGGDGGAGAGAEAGGGGGGQGGAIFLVYRFVNETIATLTGDGRLDVSGGAGGAAAGAGSAGAAGDSGIIVPLIH